MKILFIAYYFEPFSGVGAKRISYWAKNLKRVDSNISKCDVITAIPQTEDFDTIDNVFYVENTNQGLLRRFIRFDKGASWLYDLRKFVKNNIKQNEYDFVVLTGDPFLHFFIINDFKKLGIQTIIDFRDPFANNPRGILKDTVVKKIKHFVLRNIENYFLSKADCVVTVNQYCVKLFENYKKYLHKIKVIDNGYDERFFQNIGKKNYIKNSDDNVIKLTYAGKLYADRNPQIFFKCLEKFDNIEFYHIGEQSEYIKKESNQIHSLGFMPYEQAVETMKRFNVCMLFTSGYLFESTTKIFDYIALNKIILIITDGEIKTGQIHNITKDYAHIYWTKNSINEIEEVLIKIKNDYLDLIEIEFDSYTYSREYGLMQLTRLFYDK
ncbi:glycosyltransferase [Aliarcobacter butzleri]|uniref:glycosyltransferase n=1 Tax=Aliarcobacter butzleri TaxID=28197 RepID=UPI0021B2DAF3|nr:glycosyltransferase [Aliarcobacter butzleri]MCT7597604.1 glycosyltransferase [Aliarcobacter butzleri]